MNWKSFLFICCLSILAVASSQPAAGPGGAPIGFIRVNKSPLAFVDDDCKDILPRGWNA